MYPPTAPQQQPGGYPTSLVNDPETAEEVREALAIARAEARAMHADLSRLLAERARLAEAMTELMALVDRALASGPDSDLPERRTLAAVAERLRQLHRTLAEPPVLGEAA